MIKYPFHKLLLYIVAISNFDRTEFVKNLKLYLPSIRFDYENPFDYIEKFIKQKPVPGCILKGKADITGFHLFCSKFQLHNLHGIFTHTEFEDIIFDSDIRRKIDAMSISPSFRKIDILREFPGVNSIYIETYLDCFSNFEQIDNLNSYIVKYIGDSLEQKLFKKILETSSRQHLKVMLGIKTIDLSPKSLIEDSLNISHLKTQTALLEDNDDNLERWLKIRVSIAEKLIKLGAGNKSDLDNLIEALNAEPDFKDPVIYTKEQLEIEFQNNQNKAE